MSDTPVTVLLTRPAAASQQTAQALDGVCGGAAKGLQIVISPILEIVTTPLSTSLDSEVPVILTSAHAVAALSADQVPPGQRAYCVGTATAQAAQGLGFQTLCAQGDAGDLLKLIHQHGEGGPLLWLRGKHRRAELGQQLRASGIDVSERVVYDQIERALSPTAQTALNAANPIILPLYSPRSARLLGQACAAAQAPLHLVAISAAALQGWCGAAPASTLVADRPDGPAMVAALLRAVEAVASG